MEPATKSPFKSMAPILKQYEGQTIDPKTQQWLNAALPDSAGATKEEEDFLKMLTSKLESGEIDPLNTASLYNKIVYDHLSEEEKEKTDLTALNLMSILKQIQILWKQSPTATFQIKNLVETVHQMKSRFEEKHGNVYIL
jgi:hypothetical protein